MIATPSPRRDAANHVQPTAAQPTRHGADEREGYSGASIFPHLGVGGGRLHEWVVPLSAWRRTHGMPGGETNASNTIVEEWVQGIGTTVMGRNMFGCHPDPWSSKQPWNGWWGHEPPFRHHVFVLTRTVSAPDVTHLRFERR